MKRRSFSPTVIRLLAARGPSAIFGAIRIVVVDAIQGMTGGWADSEIAQELRKVRAPLFADGNAAAPIIGILDTIRVKAAHQHMLPRSVFRRDAASECPTMLHVSSDSFLASKTTARPRIVFKQRSAAHNSFAAATTSTSPAGVGCSATWGAATWSLGDNSQSLKCLSGQVDSRPRHFSAV